MKKIIISKDISVRHVKLSDAKVLFKTSLNRLRLVSGFKNLNIAKML